VLKKKPYFLHDEIATESNFVAQEAGSISQEPNDSSDVLAIFVPELSIPNSGTL